MHCRNRYPAFNATIFIRIGYVFMSTKQYQGYTINELSLTKMQIDWHKFGRKKRNSIIFLPSKKFKIHMLLTPLSS